MDKQAYCPYCKTAVGFTTKRKRSSTELDGIRYAYDVKQAICKSCKGEAIYPPYQEEAGLAFNEAVRANRGLVSLSVVEELPKRYSIGKRPLSHVLGWGEHTYSQLLNGQTPNKAHSNLLIQIYEDPFSYRTLLVAKKDDIGARTYRRSLEAVDAYIGENYPEAARIYELGRCFYHLASGDITAMAIQKLVYYAQGFSRHFFGNFIFAQMPRAWADGPVYGQLWYRFKNDPDLYFSYDEEGFSSVFKPREDEFIEAIYRHFGCYSGNALSAMTHREDPWLLARARAGASFGERCDEPLSEEEMGRFFDAVAVRYEMNRYDDIGEYAVDAFAGRVNVVEQFRR